jgi:hypothetical protein
MPRKSFMLQTIADMASTDDRSGRGIRRDYSLGEYGTIHAAEPDASR